MSTSAWDPDTAFLNMEPDFGPIKRREEEYIRKEAEAKLEEERRIAEEKRREEQALAAYMERRKAITLLEEENRRRAIELNETLRAELAITFESKLEPVLKAQEEAAHTNGPLLKWPEKASASILTSLYPTDPRTEDPFAPYKPDSDDSAFDAYISAKFHYHSAMALNGHLLDQSVIPPSQGDRDKSHQFLYATNALYDFSYALYNNFENEDTRRIRTYREHISGGAYFEDLSDAWCALLRVTLVMQPEQTYKSLYIDYLSGLIYNIRRLFEEKDRRAVTLFTALLQRAALFRQWYDWHKAKLRLETPLKLTKALISNVCAKWMVENPQKLQVCFLRRTVYGPMPQQPANMYYHWLNALDDLPFHMHRTEEFKAIFAHVLKCSQGK